MQAAGWVFPRVLPKLYLDDVVVAAAAGSWLLGGALLGACACGRALVRRRLACGSSHGLAAGELALLATVVGLATFEVWYWSSCAPRIALVAAEEAGVTGAATLASLGAAARVAGHLAALLTALTLLPAARSSVWEAALGVPFARAVAYHRALGRGAWAATAAHGGLWACKFVAEGSLAANFTGSLLRGGLVVFPDPSGGDAGLHADNFTVPIALLAFLALTASLVLAHCGVRRRPRWLVRVALAARARGALARHGLRRGRRQPREPRLSRAPLPRPCPTTSTTPYCSSTSRQP
jgi:hypothetical protein